MAGISDDDIAQVRSRVNLVDVIGEQVQLKKSGRTWRGLCPFHHEKSPSFHVDAAKQLYHCFGCGAGGDVFTFLMKTEGLDFREAVETLARKTGYTLTLNGSAQSGLKASLLKVCEAAADFYQVKLAEAIGKPARDYLSKRGLTELIGRYRLGYSPDWSSSINYLLKKGFSETEIAKAGIGGRSQRGSLYDRFKGRVIFPITDNQGRPIAFGGRVLDDSMPKYVNSPETPLYHKGSVLYGLDQAKSGCIRTGSAVIVEGYTDLLALAGAGIDNAVATLGTAFTIEHFRLLSRFAPRIVLVFDGDEAGLTAAERSSDYIGWQRLPGDEVLSGLIDKAENELLVAVLPEKLDPADFVAEAGAERFGQLTAGAQPLINFLIDRIIARHALKNSGRLIAANEAARLIGSLTSPVAQEEFMRYLADKLNIPYDTLTQEIALTRSRPDRARQSSTPSPRSAERELLRLVLLCPEKASALNDLDLDSWQDQALARLGAVLKKMAPGKASSVADILHNIDSELQALVSQMTLDESNADYSEDYFMEMFIKVKELTVERQIVILKNTLSKTDKNDKDYNNIFEKLLSLEYERRKFKESLATGGSLWVKN